MPDDVRSPSEEPGVPDEATDPRPLPYRLLTGGDDRAFCEKVSTALDEGYVLHGGPSITTRPDGTVVCAQAVVLPTS